MEKVPHHVNGLLSFLSPLVKKTWIRDLVLLPESISGKREPNEDGDYRKFKPSWLNSIEQSALYVSDIKKSREFYEKVASFKHNRTCPIEASPFNEGGAFTCCYMDSKYQKDSLVLIERRDGYGKIITPKRKQIFHIAFELADDKRAFDFAKQLKKEGHKISYGPAIHSDDPKHGDGETGGNHVLYVYDPDYHYLEFFSDMNTVENPISTPNYK